MQQETNDELSDKNGREEDECQRIEGEDIFEYFKRYASWLKTRDYGPDGNLERDALVAIILGDRQEKTRLMHILKRKNAANMTVTK